MYMNDSFSFSNGEKPYKDHTNSPPISIYMMGGTQSEMEKLSCLFCKRTIYDVKGQIDKIISTPMPTTDFDIAVNVRCKLCKSNYRLLINAK